LETEPSSKQSAVSEAVSRVAAIMATLVPAVSSAQSVYAADIEPDTPKRSMSCAETPVFDPA
jgi:hypothetical protein